MPPVDEETAETTEETPVPRPRFDFYTMLPEGEGEEPAAPAEEAAAPSNNTQTPAPPAEYFVLQAGSFRQIEDADRRRAELLMLGLDPTMEPSDSDTGRWYRVYLGPFASRAEANRARSLTAGEDIETLLLKRGNPQN